MYGKASDLYAKFPATTRQQHPLLQKSEQTVREQARSA